MIKILAAFGWSTRIFHDGHTSDECGISIEPYNAALSEYFDPNLRDEECIRQINIIQQVMSDTRPLPAPGSRYSNEYQKDCIYLFAIDDQYTAKIHPSQMIRLLSAFYITYTTKKSILMEVEMIDFIPYPEQYPIPAEEKKLPLIRLEDDIPLPEGVKDVKSFFDY